MTSRPIWALAPKVARTSSSNAVVGGQNDDPGLDPWSYGSTDAHDFRLALVRAIIGTDCRRSCAGSASLADAAAVLAELPLRRSPAVRDVGDRRSIGIDRLGDLVGAVALDRGLHPLAVERRCCCCRCCAATDRPSARPRWRRPRRRRRARSYRAGRSRGRSSRRACAERHRGQRSRARARSIFGRDIDRLHSSADRGCGRHRAG